MDRKLRNAVIRKIGKDAIKDVVEHGIDSGFNGFIYHTDTVAFYKKYKKPILELAKDMAEGLGEDMLCMIKNFSCLKDSNFSTYEIANGLAGKGNDDNLVQIQNAMAWFAAEEVCHEVYELSLITKGG